MRRALARAALIEKHYAIRLWVKELSILRHQPAAGAAVEKHDRLSFRIAALFVINLVNVRDFQPASVVGFDRGVQDSEFWHGVRILSVPSLGNKRGLAFQPNLCQPTSRRCNGPGATATRA